MIDYKALQAANEGIKTVDIKGKRYVMVNERVKGFRKALPGGTIATEILQDDDEKVVMIARVYDGDNLLSTGTAFEYKSSSYINKTSYIENCETSAVGRALGFLGIGIDDSMGSADEIANAITQQEKIKDAEKTAKAAAKRIDAIKVEALRKRCADENINTEKLLKLYKVGSFEELTENQHNNIHQYWEEIMARYGNPGQA